MTTLSSSELKTTPRPEEPPEVTFRRGAPHWIAFITTSSALALMWTGRPVHQAAGGVQVQQLDANNDTELIKIDVDDLIELDSASSGAPVPSHNELQPPASHHCPVLVNALLIAGRVTGGGGPPYAGDCDPGGAAGKAVDESRGRGAAARCIARFPSACERD
jgi:hypothetical protein